MESEPWAVAEKGDEDSRSRLGTILYTAAEALRIITALLHPVAPDSTARVWSQLGLGDITKFGLADLKWGQLEVGTKLGKVEPVFPRTDKAAIERMQQLEQQGRAVSADVKKPPAAASVSAKAAEAAVGQTSASGSGAQTQQPATAVATSASTPAKPPAAIPEGKISIDDFVKVEMRVGEVKVAEKVKGADKLLRLEVDIGTEVRQVVAGIAEAYDPATLVGRKVALVVNLAPRKLRGLESNGMIVAASVGDKGKPVLVGFLEDVPIGARLK